MPIAKFPGVLMLAVLANVGIYGQPINVDSHIVDSLEPLLSKAVNDTNKVNNLMILAGFYDATNDYDRSLLYARMADTISTNLKYDRGRVRSLAHIAFVYAATGNWPKSFAIVDEVWPIAEKASPEVLPFLCSIMFMNYGFRFEWSTAKTWGLRALNQPVFAKLPDEARWPTYMQLTLAYAYLDSFETAEHYASYLRQYIDRKLNAPAFLENAYRALGLLASRKKNYKEAIDYYRRDMVNAAGLAAVYDELKETDSAKYYANIGLQSAIKRKTPPDIIESASILARLYEKTDTALAYKYLQIRSAARDSLYNSNWREAEEKRVLGKQKEQFQRERDEANFRNRIIQISLIALAAVFLISALLFFRSNKIRQNANRKLEKAYGELKATQAQLIQSEKMASLGELTAGIAHEIQNPLNFVNNFSEVNKELLTELSEELDKGNYDGVRGIVKDIMDNEGKIVYHGKRADSIVKGMLLHSRTSTGQKERIDINALCDEYLRLAYHGLRAKDKSFSAKIETNFDDTLGKIDVIPQDIGRVILNLINNAFYAVSEKVAVVKEHEGHEENTKNTTQPYEPTVTVSTRRSTIKNEVLISIKDNGDGIPQRIIDKIFQPFFTTKPTGQGTGLGLSLAYDIVKAHGGEIKVETKEGEGSEFTIVLPV